MSFDAPSDAEATLGHNGGPALDAELDTIDPRHLLVAWRALRAICAAIGEDDHHRVQAKRQGGDALSIRNLWLWAMASHIPNNVIAKISTLNRKTVTLYVQQVERHAERNGLLRSFCDMVADMVEPIPGIVDDAQEALADFAVEASIDRVKKARQLLERTPRMAGQG